MLLNPPIPLAATDMDLVLRLGAAAAIGLLIGLDRELRDYPAGLRTHSIVCFSAALMTVSILALYLQLGGPDTRMDPLRLFEGTAAFIGIVAAGLIVVSKGEVRNLTTAVHVWLATAIGIACGAGQWPLVAMGTAGAVLLMTVLRPIETRWIDRKRDRIKPEERDES